MSFNYLIISIKWKKEDNWFSFGFFGRNYHFWPFQIIGLEQLEARDDNDDPIVGFGILQDEFVGQVHFIQPF